MTCDPIPVGYPLPKGATLKWRDEFTDPLINANEWYVRDNDTYGDGNHEEQRYFARNVAIVQQQLALVAKQEQTGIGSGVRAYTSGFVKGRKSFVRGFFEVCASLPKGGGFWPAFWLTGDPNNASVPPWPAYGEFDVFEGYGGDYVESTVHWSEGGHHAQWGGQTEPITDASAKHIYGLEWGTDALTVWIDGELRWKWLAQTVDAKKALTYPHVINLNLAVGGDGPRKWHGWDGTWPGGFPKLSTMMIDYVRVWQ